MATVCGTRTFLEVFFFAEVLDVFVVVVPFAFLRETDEADFTLTAPESERAGWDVELFLDFVRGLVPIHTIMVCDSMCGFISLFGIIIFCVKCKIYNISLGYVAVVMGSGLLTCLLSLKMVQ